MADFPYRISYGSVLEQVAAYYGQGSPVWNSIVADSATGFSSANYGYLEQIGINPILAQDGSVLGYYQTAPMPSHAGGTYEVVNSNVQGATYSGNSTAVKVNGTATQTQVGNKTQTTFNSGAKTVNAGARVMTVLAEASGYVFGASIGGKLGLQFSQALYDSGVSWAWSKEDWAHFIQNDADSLDKAVFSFLTGIDANGNSTMYADEEALAQMYMMMRQMGMFDAGDITVDTSDVPISSLNRLSNITDLKLYQSVQFTMTAGTAIGDRILTPINNTSPVYIVCNKAAGTGNNAKFIGYSENPFSIHRVLYKGSAVYSDTVENASAVTYNNKTYYVCPITSSYMADMNNMTPQPNISSFQLKNGNPTYPSIANDITWDVAHLIFEGDIEGGGSVDGVEPDPQATTYIDPSLINGQDRDAVLQQLRQNYPELFDGEIYQDVPQQDGTIDRKKYVPVPYVTPSSKPVTGNNHQNNPSANPQTNTQTELDKLVDLITQLLTPTDIPDTGDGDTPTVVPPTGSASSLWAVYNPTQAQVDAFGSWLWSSNFVEQLKKLFADPMQAIIGIHKVFATPSTGAAQTIKCGYIDSGVSSAVVTAQYTTIDCGTVNLREYFGNVFDYSPFTEVSLYLPFIGIVKLDVSDVMRASIKVKYHVDVITGACLADVVVNRDGAGGVLYQYAGSAIVTYPISSGSYASAIGGILSIAGGIAATVMTGGAAAPAVLGAAAGISHLHSDVQKSGSFTGAAGAMGGKIPYLIISRPQTGMPSSFAHLQGYPVNYYTKVGSCTGHIRVSDVQVKGVNATDTELDMIRDALTQGVEI